MRPTKEEDLAWLQMFEGPRTLGDALYFTDEEMTRLCDLAGGMPPLAPYPETAGHSHGKYSKNAVMVVYAFAKAKVSTRPDPLSWDGWPLGEPGT